MRVRFSKRSIDDLENIRDWLKREASPDVAADQITKLLASLRYLQDFPEIAPVESEAVRRKSVRNAPYLIFYRISKSSITIVRIRRNREDWQS